MSLIYRLIFKGLACLPLPLLHGAGALLGRLAYRLSPRTRAQTRANLVQAFGAAEADRLLPTVMAESGKGAFELPTTWLSSLEAVTDRVKQVSGWEHVAEAQARGKGVIFLTPHLGCFEIAAQYLARHAHGVPITVLYREPKQAWLKEFLLAGRVRGERMKVAAADLAGVRSLIRALKHKEMVGLLPDQAPGAGQGEWLPFFGRPAYTMTLAARLTETGAATLFVYMERLPGGQGYHYHIRPPLTPLEGDTVARAAQINREVEAMIRECPAQYLWSYNRYKQPSGAPPAPEANAAAPMNSPPTAP
ncbi:lipid A biosynthesis lauroyl acyltransferase [Oryzomicrobium terrae]|uniref:Lipid A biosynthesis lauroyl acyltransferase n=1 Tax=Oryzomicrobium terrae TaxID=1735038 RepID=A0A5C1E642_9RHOO|nr:lysophospholipid acyltransferase family protein [Oryzomicrobium terrae]QEL63767.1 lipid A biosynthesis lauroyl acyltransferase [Oryzomicrobium terrae]